MRYIFDSSAIYSLVKRDMPEFLAQNYTCDLARYELGNILINEGRIKTLSEAEQKSSLDLIVRALNLLAFVDIRDNEESILQTAIDYTLSFYDAAYVELASRTGAILVTEDKKLAKKVNGHIKVISAEELFA